MRYTLLLATVAATALLGAPAAFAQTVSPGVRPMPSAPAEPAMPMPAPQTMPAPAAVPAAQAAVTQAQANNVIDVLQAQGHFTTLLAALDSAHLTDTLKSHAAVSIFAPTDAAFAAMSEADRTRLMDPANAAELRQLLLYHVIVADVEDAQIRGHAGPVETAAGARIQLNGTGANLMADNATITGARLEASNGAVFAIDHVLTPTGSQAATGDGDDAPVAVPAVTPPVQTPDPADGAPDGTEPNPTSTPVPVPSTPQG